ncbi:MAG TPA: hypothetical protein VHC39_01220 [Rhizomicrobium sp.]|nr:hypothetical protein [Rhizomicrobium sp.]
MTVLSEGSNSVIVTTPGFRFNWSAVIAGAAVAAATGFFLIMLGAGFGLMLRSSTGTFLTLGAIWVLAAQAFGFAAGGHVAGRLIGPRLETHREEEFRAGAHGLVMWAITVAAGLVLLALAAAGGAAMHREDVRSETSVSAYWADMLLHPDSPHAMARGEDIAQDKVTAARILSADLHPGNQQHGANRAELIRLTAMDAGLSYAGATDRVNMVEDRMRQELDTARKAAGYAALWTALALLFGAVVAVAAAISAGWEDDKLSFGFARRY